MNTKRCGLAAVSALGVDIMASVRSPYADELSRRYDQPPRCLPPRPQSCCRTPDPAELSAKFYIALGMKLERVSERGSHFIFLEGHVGSLGDSGHGPQYASPAGRRPLARNKGVVAIFETTDQEEVVRRAKAAGSPMIEKWTSSQADVSIYYIADPENNIFGFAPRQHNPNIPTP